MQITRRDFIRQNFGRVLGYFCEDHVEVVDNYLHLVKKPGTKHRYQVLEARRAFFIKYVKDGYEYASRFFLQGVAVCQKVIGRTV